ncbi:hypothetical protein QQF64_026154 [Cirrhinus molitorella]|uniref:Uncharacterized protein n=1 Tax=Cirrhinus molitorella TaxID=172907 RepID=A0ABR3NRR8_9TELE
MDCWPSYPLPDMGYSVRGNNRRPPNLKETKTTIYPSQSLRTRHKETSSPRPGTVASARSSAVLTSKDSPKQTQTSYLYRFH